MLIDLEKWNKLVDRLCDKVIRDGYYKKGKVYGIPRGGCLVAMEVARRVGMDLIDKPEKGCLVVDDLIDSGVTKEKFKEYTFLALIDKQTEKEFKSKWIEFWYESTQKDDKDLVLRLAQRLNVEVN